MKAQKHARAKGRLKRYKPPAKKFRKTIDQTDLESDLEPDESIESDEEETDTDPPTSDDEEEWEIERLVARRPTRSGKFIYQARWKGWGPEWDEWKTAKELEHAQGLVDEYEARLAKWEAAAESQSDSECYESSPIPEGNNNVKATPAPAESSAPEAKEEPQAVDTVASAAHAPVSVSAHPPATNIVIPATIPATSVPTILITPPTASPQPASPAQKP